MTPEEIVAEISCTNRTVLCLGPEQQSWTREQVLSLMDTAAMRGFRFGSNVALSMVQGELVVQLSRMTPYMAASKAASKAGSGTVRRL